MDHKGFTTEPEKNPMFGNTENIFSIPKIAEQRRISFAKSCATMSPEKPEAKTIDDSAPPKTPPEATRESELA